MSDFDRVLALGAETPDIYNHRAEAFAQTRDNSKRRSKAIPEAIRLRLDDPMPWKGRGLEYAVMHKYREAIEDFNAGACI